jgi:transglutaminase-like putative cysteine protease
MSGRYSFVIDDAGTPHQAVLSYRTHRARASHATLEVSTAAVRAFAQAIEVALVATTARRSPNYSRNYSRDYSGTTPARNAIEHTFECRRGDLRLEATPLLVRSISIAA